ncbi:ral guanine nucleotide dissociation stimulator-like 1 [Lingula anatina]|uniref:Ral guanine nucleotide dissociation stimulator-like 1 n=1 Tax=Lingula anatina TaxID=7574 RepID=A0A2R2MKH4_LINAN|nr:ral guanine nucleotide dissociation stimulator-like 1 [Lingula anatina]|eukprot:XP_023930724.1 ral guanine nucleotide dissociation stimulator-like 1 [Lingula anatina]
MNGNIDFHLNLCDEVDFMIDTEYQKPLDFMSIPNAMFAQQLTYMDAQLFKKVLPHHCLGSVWSNRKDKKKLDAPSVVATVDQFNRVSYRVIATVLKQPDMKASQRAKIIAKWIDIAQELRVLKNFSSLKAIVSGLQSNSVFRLKRVWSMLPKAMLHGGDNDSTGVIAGACYGAMYGFQGVPENHYKKLEYRDRLEKVAEQLYQLANN